MSRADSESTAGLDPEIASPLAARCQELGYSSMWSNDHPGAKGLETLAEYAKGADRIDLGVAVIALDRQRPKRSPPTSTGSASTATASGSALGAGFTEQAADRDARGSAGASRGAARHPARPRRDGAEDVRVRRARSGTASSSTG